MSQHPTSSTAVTSMEEKMAEEYVRVIGSSATPVAFTTQEIQLATSHDSTLQAVMELVRTSNWHHIDLFELAEGVDYQAFLTFRLVKDELTVTDSLVLRNPWIVLPKALQQLAIDLPHKGHQGITKTKALMRTKLWFPNIDQLVQDSVQKCIPRTDVNMNRFKCPNYPVDHGLTLVWTSVVLC